MNETAKRAAFLAGEGTLTAGEVRDWALELEPMRGMPALPAGMGEDEPLMVSVVRPAEVNTRGLAGATVIRGVVDA